MLCNGKNFNFGWHLGYTVAEIITCLESAQLLSMVLQTWQGIALKLRTRQKTQETIYGSIANKSATPKIIWERLLFEWLDRERKGAKLEILGRALEYSHGNLAANKLFKTLVNYSTSQRDIQFRLFHISIGTCIGIFLSLFLALAWIKISNIMKNTLTTQIPNTLALPGTPVFAEHVWFESIFIVFPLYMYVCSGRLAYLIF